MSDTVLNISYTFIQEKGINVITFYLMRKVRHAANEWAKEDLNPGLNLKPTLLTTMYKENNKLSSDSLRKLKGKMDHKRLGSERCLVTQDCREERCGPGIPEDT